MVLGNRQHPSRPARRVEEGAHDSGPGKDLVVLGEEQVDHQADDLAGGEVLSRRLIGQFGESPDQLLVEVAHLQVGDDVGVEVDVGELADHLVEQIGLRQPCDLDVEVELVDDLPCAAAEPGDVAPQVPGDLAGVVEEAAEVEGRGVVEVLPGHVLQDRVDVLDLPSESSARSRTAALVGSRTQSRRRITVRGRMTLPYSDCL